MRGIAFPIPPPTQTKNYYFSTDDPVNGNKLNNESYLSGWISVLEQLANDSNFNTIRLYEMDCRFNYSSFFSRAAELGIYAMVPLTTLSGPGVLSRTTGAPLCYPRKLFDYGATCLERFWDHPNVIAGVIGNEVMNGLKAWTAAPCVKAYLDDLARHQMKLRMGNHSGNKRQSLPLIYANQHDSPGAEQSPDEAIKLTFDYLSCRYTSAENSRASTNSHFLDNVAMFGINIESWCSSLQTFEYEENGIDESSYHSLWRTLFMGTRTETKMDAVTGEVTVQELPTISPEPLDIPIVFSEIGCSKKYLNRDNGLRLPSLARDWKQIPVVLDQPMSDLMSGFIAYAYDGGGNEAFRMMGGDNSKWDGVQPLPPSEDYENFCTELSISSTMHDTNDIALDGNENRNSAFSSPVSCEEISSKLENIWDVNLYSIAKMPSYSEQRQQYHTSILDESAVDVLFVPDASQVPFVVRSALGFSFFAAAVATLLAVKHKWAVVRKDVQILRKVSTDYGSCDD